MDELRNAIKGKTDRSLDRMVKATNSPVTTAVLECPIPSKFMLPQLKPFDGFEQLSNAFLRYFIRGQCPKRPTDHLLTIRQGEKETLRSYVKCFTRETLEVDEADNKVQLMTFKARLKSRKFVVSLVKNSPKTMVEILLKAQKYMNAEDALVAIKDVEKPRDKERKKDYRKG